MDERSLAATRATAALVALPGVDDGVVLERLTLGGRLELVAYVVPVGPPVPDQWHAALVPVLPADALPASYVAVSELPLTADGEVDEPELLTLPTIDQRLAAGWEERLRATAGVANASVRIDELVRRQKHLHLSHLIPVRRAPLQSETPGDRAPAKPSAPRARAFSRGPELTRPVPRNLVSALKDAAFRCSSHGVTYIGSAGSATHQSYPELIADSERILGGLRALGLKPQHPVILQLSENQDFLPAFWACVAGGFVPVPVAVPASYRDESAGTGKLRSAWQMLGRPPVLRSRHHADEDAALRQCLGGAALVASVAALREYDADRNWHDPAPDTTAVLLLTSGSTGVPKGVPLTHANVLTRSAASAQANQLSSRDRSVNWLPLDHVGGIVMLHLQDVYLGAAQLHAATDFVLEDPLRWLDLLEQHRATFTWAPNFAFGLVAGREDEVARRRWDLSSMRVILNGGEAIVASTAERFLKVLAPHGLAANALRPAWGMSETSSGVTFSDTFGLDRQPTHETFVDLGPPVPGVSLRIVDERDAIVDEDVVGRVQITGAPVIAAYYDNPQLNAESFSVDGWFNTGDLGVLRQGRLTLTGRSKDVIIVNGANFHSHEVEATVDDIAGVERSFTAACAVQLPGSDSERTCIFFSPAAEGWANSIALIHSIRQALLVRMGLRPDYVIPVARTAIPKTAIGKIQRAQLKARFEAGEFDEVVERVDVEIGNVRTIPDWFYEPVWVARKRRLTEHLGAGRYLIFADRLGLADAVCRALAAQGADWISVRAGARFAEGADGDFTLDPWRRDDYRLLSAALDARGVAVDHVLHLWCYTPYDYAALTPARLSQAQFTGTYSLLALVQAFPSLQAGDRPSRLVFVSTHAQDAGAGERVAIEKATATGFLKALALEAPGLDIRHIDFDAWSVARDAHRLIDELRLQSSRPEVAYRQDRRLERYISPVDLPREAPDTRPVENGGAYLVSGGLGGLGTQVAQYLVREHRAKVLLIGETPLPGGGATDPGGEPAERAAHVARRARNLDAVRAAATNPADVLYRAVDLCDLAGLRAAVVEAQTQWGQPLAGVFHLAGVGSLERHAHVIDHHWVNGESIETFEWMFQSKVYGTRNLFELLKGRPDALFVAFSSVNATFGGATFSAYSAANSFLDACCSAHRAGTHPRTYCFNWTMWDDVGMSEAAPSYVREGSHGLGYQVLSKAQGLQSLIAGLCRRPRQLIVGLDGSNRHIRRHLREECRPLQRLTAFYSRDAGTTDVSIDHHSVATDRFGRVGTCELVPVPPAAWREDGSLAPDAGLTGVATAAPLKLAPRTPTEARLARLWREVLLLPEVGVNDTFFELGGDSLSGMRLVNRIRQEFGTDASLRMLLERPTIAALAAALPSGESTNQRTDGTPPVAASVEPDVDIAGLSDAEVDALLRELSSADVSGV